VFNLEPGSWVAWIIVGLVAGWLAGRITRGGGFGCITNVVIGLIGAFVGTIILSALGISGSAQFLGSIAVSTLGAVVLLAIANLARR
jgi:uncharacterized membrane protein YeaQ/YmgE (transglycosylase-associated protein family)